MIRPRRTSILVSTVAIAALLSGCAVGTQTHSMAGMKVAKDDVGLAMRAQAALNSGQLNEAVELAERAVEKTPDDAGLRSLLANCYFAAGRFASAEQAYSDSLTLLPPQPKVILKLALVQIAQGKNSQALATLNTARGALDPSDYGLAVALAGHPDDAVAVLNNAARVTGADARVRQNLALAYGLSGDWAMARAIASQDVPPDQLDGRIQQWMAMATPSAPSDQVAMLTGVHPAADPGQPVRLALNSAPQGQRYAVAPAVESAPEPQAVALADIPPAPPALPDPEPAVANVASAEPVEEAPASLVASLIEPLPQPVEPAPQVASVEAPVVEAVAPAPVPQTPTRFDTPVEPAKYVAIGDKVRKAAEKARKPAGRSSSVVQLGAYSSPDRVSVAWDVITKRHPALAKYTPVRARFDGPKGTVWRLSIKGFESDHEARARCELLQSRGGKCFVRRVAGDAPVQFASR